MRIGGWLRLWIVLAAIWAVPIALLAYEDRPERGDIESTWAYEGIRAVAEAVSEEEGRTVYAHEVRTSLEDHYPTDRELIGWLEKVEQRPTPNQAALAPKLSKVNSAHRARITRLPEATRDHYLAHFLGWSIPLLVVLLFGYAIRWIRSGFRNPEH